MHAQHVRTTALIACVALSLALGGCASSGGMAASTGPSTATPAKAAMAAPPFPTGRFQNGDMVAVMNPDGSYVGTTPQGEDWVRGRYVVTGDTVTITDSWMADAYKDNSCVGKGTGRYRWTSTATGTRYTLIEDACAARARGLGDSGVWTRIP